MTLYRLNVIGRRTLIAIAMLSVAGIFCASADPIDRTHVRVTDGDTIRYKGQPYRLVGFDAPETGTRSRCPAERDLGHQATLRLRELVSGGDLDLTEVVCSCPTGTMGTPRCNYGRRCGTLTSMGKDVGAILIAEKLAHPLRCTKTRCERLQSWCE